MRVRKDEREAMVRLLEEEHEDVEALSSDVLMLAWSALLDREWWSVLHFQPGVWTSTHGPFESRAQALKYITTVLVSAGPEPTKAIAVPMIKGGMAVPTQEGMFDA